MEFDWAPLNPADFKDLGRFIELRAALVNVLRSKLTQSAQFLADTVQQCDAQGCTARTCLLYRGMVTLRATREMLEEKKINAAPAAVRWSTISEMCQTSNHRVLQVACTYDRSQEVAVAILIPSEVLVDLLLPEALPQWGIWGTAVIPFQVLLRGCARKAFTSSSSVWANDALTRVEFSPETMAHALDDVADKISGMEQHRTLDMHLKRSADEEYAARAQENRVKLQATINKFWSTIVNSLRQRLGNRAKKIACRESLDCDGINCDYCRGAMVFHLASLEGPDKAWCYEYRGQVLDSSTPKEYPRGEWRTALELCSLYGCNDAGLLGTVLTYDRKEGFPVTLHVPHSFLEPSMVRVPPKGALYWKFLPYEGSLEPALPAQEDEQLGADGPSKRASSHDHEGSAEPALPAQEDGQLGADGPSKRASSQGVQQEQPQGSRDHQQREARPSITSVDASDLALLEKVSTTRWGRKSSHTGSAAGEASTTPREGHPADQERGRAAEHTGQEAGTLSGKEADQGSGHGHAQPEAGPSSASQSTATPGMGEGSLEARDGAEEGHGRGHEGVSTQHEAVGLSGAGTDSHDGQGVSGQDQGESSTGVGAGEQDQEGGAPTVEAAGMGAEGGEHGSAESRGGDAGGEVQQREVVSSAGGEGGGAGGGQEGESSGPEAPGEHAHSGTQHTQLQQLLESRQHQQQQQQQQGQQAHPYRCALRGCCVWEEESTGVQLLVCSCKHAVYCTRDHQRLDWKAHAPVHKALLQQQQQQQQK